MSDNEFSDFEETFTIKKKVKSETTKEKSDAKTEIVEEVKANPNSNENGHIQEGQNKNSLWSDSPEPEKSNETKDAEKMDSEEKKVEQQVVNHLWEDDESHVNFYSKKTNIEQYERRNLQTIDMRNYHNWIKSVLINKYTTELKKNYRKNHRGFLDISVLEVGCGTGGDLKKWYHNGISYLLGVDVSRASLDSALTRWKELKEQKKKKFLVDFIKVSAGAPEEIFFQHIPNDIYFDIVSSQFVIHYLFASEKSAENLMNNISKKLCQGGYFICSIPDSDVIVKRIRTLGKKTSTGEIVLGNEFYSIKFQSDKFPRGKPYGIEYGFFLDDSAVGSKTVDENGNIHITYVPEYLIIFENLVKLAKKYDLELVEDKNFHDFCKEAVKVQENFDLMKRMGLEDIGKISPQLWEISYLYKIVVFRKVKGAEMNFVERRFKEYARCTVVEADEVMEEEPQKTASPQNNENDQIPDNNYDDPFE